MAKSELQKRAENASKLFNATARKPIVIEFAGVPKSGKTTTISQLQALLKRCGFKTEIVIERASVCPIRDKKHVNFNIWTACTTLAQLLEKTQIPPRADDPQILILDRGIFDSLCWLRTMETLNRLRPEERKIVQKFLEISDWRERITGVILMTVSSADSMKREQGLLPVEGGSGSIMNPDVLDKMTKVCRTMATELKDLFRIFEVDTSTSGSSSTAKETAEKVADQLLKWIEEQLEENILSLPKSDIKTRFAGKTTITKKTTENIIKRFHEIGTFAPRSEVESNKELVQALPVVVVKNASGEILRLRRKESSPSNQLHEKIVIWAGGHVRREDNTNENAIPACAVREIEEELRLRIDEDELNLLGAVYIDEGVSTGKHLAIVYEWKAQTDDLAVALSNAEFFERRGTSLSGKFVPITQLVKELENGKMSEQWSDAIIRYFLVNNSNDVLTERLL